MTRADRAGTGEVLRFLVAGGANTLVAYAVYLVLLHFMRYELAYAVGYVVGIATAYVLNTAFVFRQPMRAQSATRFPLVYVAQFAISLVILRAAVESAGIPRWLALAVSIAVTLPITFFLSRWIIRRN